MRITLEEIETLKDCLDITLKSPFLEEKFLLRGKVVKLLDKMEDKYDQYVDEVTIEELKNDNSKRVSILTYRGEGDPVRRLDDKIKEYTNGEQYWEFIDMNMDNPWTRVIVFGEL